MTQERDVEHNYRISMILICNSFVFTQPTRPLADPLIKDGVHCQKSSHPHERDHTEKSLLNRINILFSLRGGAICSIFRTAGKLYMRIINFTFLIDLLMNFHEALSENERKIIFLD